MAFLILTFVGINSYAQSNEQRLVGSWTSLHNNSTVVFNANGTGTGFNTIIKTIKESMDDNSSNSVISNYAVAGNRVVLYTPNSKDTWILNYIISNDGRTLIITFSVLGTSLGLAYKKN